MAHTVGWFNQPPSTQWPSALRHPTFGEPIRCHRHHRLGSCPGSIAGFFEEYRLALWGLV